MGVMVVTAAVAVAVVVVALVVAVPRAVSRTVEAEVALVPADPPQLAMCRHRGDPGPEVASAAAVAVVAVQVQWVLLSLGALVRATVEAAPSVTRTIVTAAVGATSTPGFREHQSRCVGW
jgi:hypothetical protein